MEHKQAGCRGYWFRTRGKGADARALVCGRCHAVHPDTAENRDAAQDQNARRAGLKDNHSPLGGKSR